MTLLSTKEFTSKVMWYVIPDSRESFLKNQKDCGQAAMTKISEECGVTFGLISNLSLITYIS